MKETNNSETLSFRFNNILVICVYRNIFYQEWMDADENAELLDEYEGKLLIVWMAEPVDPEKVISWKNAVIELPNIRSHRVIYMDKEDDISLVKDRIKKMIPDWAAAVNNAALNKIRIGSKVIVNKERKFEDPYLISFFGGAAGSGVVEMLDSVKKQYRLLIGRTVGKRRDKFLQKLGAFFEYRENEDFMDIQERYMDVIKSLERERFMEVNKLSLPRVLILGESGVGKTIIAKYLAWRTSPNSKEERLYRPFIRIPMPMYSNREEYFESDIFGYRGRTWTDAPDNGNFGYLLQNLGGVVFFDEIGDASPIIQAKMLAFLDDYKVQPKGWKGDGIFCPALVAAATNKKLEGNSLKKDDFRNDLLRRFNYILKLPSLNERKDELPYWVDILLQLKHVNPYSDINYYTSDVLDYLEKYDFRNSNFRQLTIMLKKAVYKAYIDNRSFIYSGDF